MLLGLWRCLNPSMMPLQTKEGECQVRIVRVGGPVLTSSDGCVRRNLATNSMTRWGCQGLPSPPECAEQ